MIYTIPEDAWPVIQAWYLTRIKTALVLESNRNIRAFLLRVERRAGETKPHVHAAIKHYTPAPPVIPQMAIFIDGVVEPAGGGTWLAKDVLSGTPITWGGTTDYVSETEGLVTVIPLQLGASGWRSTHALTERQPYGLPYVGIYEDSPFADPAGTRADIILNFEGVVRSKRGSPATGEGVEAVGSYNIEMVSDGPDEEPPPDSGVGGP